MIFIPGGKENASKTVGTTQPRKRRGRNKLSFKKVNSCTECGFKSDRAYNVFRHYGRIHEPMKKRRTCCDLKFICKADYYRHCAKYHPNKRKYTLTTRTKYGITGSDNEKKNDDDHDDDDGYENDDAKKEENEDKPMRRKSLRRIAKLAKNSKNLDLHLDFDFGDENDAGGREDKSSNIRNKSKKNSKKKFIEMTKSKSVEVSFQGDASCTSHEQAKIQSEFLADIDFESLKLSLNFKKKDRYLRLA